MPSQPDPESVRVAVELITARRPCFPRTPLVSDTCYRELHVKHAVWDHWDQAGRFCTVFFDRWSEQYPLAQSALACAANQIVLMLHAATASTSHASFADAQNLLDDQAKSESDYTLRSLWTEVWVHWKAIVDELDLRILESVPEGLVGRPTTPAEMMIMLEDYLELEQAAVRLVTAMS